jgi:CubicO group peptidase (beta-lactamase class C family)
MLDAFAVTQIRKALRAAIDSHEIAGANLLVMHKGEELLYHEDGMADIEANRPIRRDSLFRLYSMSKPITAAAVMALFESGLLDLNEPVSKFLPGFKNQKVAAKGKLVPAEREVTIHHLLSMTSGLVYGGDDPAGQATEALFREVDERLPGENPMGTVELANRLGACPLAFQPGSSWQYGTSADVLGAVVEVVSGKRFGEFLHETFFDPLEMKDTGFWLTEAHQDGRMASTYTDLGPQLPMARYEGNHLGIIHSMDRAPAFESGGAGLVSSLDDYARFGQMLLNGGSWEGRQILRPATVAYYGGSTLNAAQQPGFIERFGMHGYSYGNLMRVLTDPSRAAVVGSPGEYGWDGWLGCYFCNCPQDRLTFLLMMQRKDSGTMPITRKLRNIVLAALRGEA